jgi:hypothetical protein
MDDDKTIPDVPGAKLNELFAALAKAQGQITSAAKGKTNPHFKSAYADLASVWEAIRKPLSDNGLAVIQFPLTDGDRVGIRTILGHSSGQWLADTAWAKPQQAGPQAQGSCWTYLKRYALCAVAGVAPDDDDDGNAGSRPGERYTAGGGPAQPPKGEASGTTAPPATAPPNGVTTTTDGGPRSMGKRPSADKIKHNGRLLSDGQLKKLQILRRECGGVFTGEDDNPQSLWRMKVLGVYRDQAGERITSSTKLSSEQAGHCIERLEEYKAKVTAKAQEPLDIGPAEDSLTELAAAINKATTNAGEYQDVVRELCAPFGVDGIGELHPDQARLALALLLARGDAAQTERVLSEIHA